MKTAILNDLDLLTKTRTPFGSFGDMVNAGGNYRPSLDMSKNGMRMLANAYDKAQSEKGDSRRAERYYTIKNN